MSAIHDATAEAEPLHVAGHSDEKARQILDGARAVFLRDGFDGASMNDIARVAGVSKGTLYVYFASKESLFAALIRHDKRQQAEQTCRFDDTSGDVRQVLTTMGTSLAQMLCRPDHVAQVRTVIAVAPRFPEIGRAFYEAGPKHGLDRFSRYLDGQVALGVLAIDDTRMAAGQFTQLCLGDAHKRVMFGVCDTIDPDEIATNVAAAVAIFMKVYGR